MSIPDRELPETLDRIAKLVASVSTRLDTHGEALAHVAKAQAEAREDKGEGGDPDYVARATAEAVRRALVPELHKIVDTMDGLTGGKALLRERWRAFDKEEARQGRWRFQPWAVSLGIPLALLLAAVMPYAVAQTPLTCRAAGGWWMTQTERNPAACLLEAQGRLHQATGEDGQADAEGS